MVTLVLTIIGDDRSGLVESLAAAVANHGGSWNTSSMARLGSKFAGIVEITVPEKNADALVDEFGPLEAKGLLDITVERTDRERSDVAGGTASARGDLHIVGQDRPGIVHEISQAVARHGVSIELLQTSTASAPMSGELLFEATAVLVADDVAKFDLLTADLETLADELMVDVELNA